MSTVRLALAETNKKFLSMITEITDKGYNLNIAFQTDNETHLLKLLDSITTDIILLDSTAPNLGSIKTFENIRKSHPNSKIIALYQHEQETNIIEMLICGVKSLLSKEESSDELYKAIQVVYDGGVYISDYSVGIIQHHLAKTFYQVKPSPLPTISEEERRLIKMISEGLTSKQIGARLYKSHRTVDDMREKLYRKFEVSNKVELIRLAMKYELQ